MYQWLWDVHARCVQCLLPTTPVTILKAQLYIQKCRYRKIGRMSSQYFQLLSLAYAVSKRRQRIYHFYSLSSRHIICLPMNFDDSVYNILSQLTSLMYSDIFFFSPLFNWEMNSFCSSLYPAKANSSLVAHMQKSIHDNDLWHTSKMT